MPIPTAPSELDELQVGDKVLVKRVLDHPAGMKQVPCDPRNGSTTKYVRDTQVVEELGVSSVMDRRAVPAIAAAGNWPGREAHTLVRLPNGFWYDCATGLQDGSGSTRIERMH
jgi:hypothetical protein